MGKLKKLIKVIGVLLVVVGIAGAVGAFYGTIIYGIVKIIKLAWG